MDRPSPRRESILVAGLAALATGVIALAGGIGPADRAIYDQIATRLPERMGRSALPLVIVAIDEPSFAELGLAWPWPRDLHARLVESLRAAGARTIGLDVVIADPGTGDAALAAAMAPDVVLAADRAIRETPQGRVDMVVAPLPALTAAGARIGLVPLPLDPDGAVRALPPAAGSFAAALVGSAPAPPPGALIDMREAPAELTRVSYYQALDAANLLPPDLFRGKVALVGTTLGASPELTLDGFRTPWTARGAGLMPGVELQARAAATLASESWARPARRWAAPLLALLAAGLAVAGARGRVAPAAVFLAAGIAALLVGASGALLAAGVWLPPAAPALAALVAGVGQAGLDHARERRQRREITRSFEHYVAPEVVRRLAADPSALRLGGERRRISILFCDLRGFTALSERMQGDPETLTALLNRALTVVADAILASGGLVDKFIGDCVMGLWNAPLDTSDHAARAVGAGLAAIRGVERLSAELAAEAAAEGRAAPTLACGVGVNTGECTVGNMGTNTRFEYTALGDPVNVASRLEGLTKVYGVPMLVGEATVAEIGAKIGDGIGDGLGDAGFVELDAAVIRGRIAPVRVFVPAALTEASGASAPAAGTAPILTAPGLSGPGSPRPTGAPSTAGRA